MPGAPADHCNDRVHLDLRAAASVPPEGRPQAECTRLVALRRTRPSETPVEIRRSFPLFTGIAVLALRCQ
jgi:hypothetical protein